jgi:hypothetical protein
LTTATVEFDARPGPLRDAVAETMKRWHGALEREARIAAEAGELPPGADPADVAFELNALAAAASYGFQLSRDPEVFERARRSMRRALGADMNAGDGGATSDPGRPAGPRHRVRGRGDHRRGKR